jgi:hypothetical protein
VCLNAALTKRQHNYLSMLLVGFCVSFLTSVVTGAVLQFIWQMNYRHGIVQSARWLPDYFVHHFLTEFQTTTGLLINKR